MCVVLSQCSSLADQVICHWVTEQTLLGFTDPSCLLYISFRKSYHDNLLMRSQTISHGAVTASCSVSDSTLILASCAASVKAYSILGSKSCMISSKGIFPNFMHEGQYTAHGWCYLNLKAEVA